MKRNRVIGVDLGGTTTKFGLYDNQAKLLHQWAIPTDTTSNGSHILKNMCDSIKQTLKENKLTVDSLLGVGIGTPGVVDNENGTVCNAFNLGWADKQDVKASFTKQGLSIPLYLTNDANCAAYGEGNISNDESVVFITLGTGVGGGVIIDNKILQGNINSAGEIGHMRSYLNYGFTCTCGNGNCLESVASATGIVNVAKKESEDFNEYSQLNKMIKENKDITAKTVFDLAKQDDKLANKVVDLITHDLGVSCGNIANLLNPKSIIIGGGVSHAGTMLLDKIVSVFNTVAFPLVKTSTNIKLATLGNDAGITGAAYMVIKGETKHDETI
jgi:glucokinase